MKKYLLNLLLLGVYAYAQDISGVGINTSNVDPSAILELNADDPLTNSSKKGFLPPRVQLSNVNDNTSIPSPAVGLLVFNLSNSGTYPNQVVANNYYFWDGTKWERLIYKSVVEESVKPRIFYIESSVRQDFTAADMNSAGATNLKDQVLTFESPTSNIKNIITFDANNSTFRANYSGIYEFSAFVNYNPMTSTQPPLLNFNNRAFLNLKIQLSTNNGVSWQNSIGTRTAWGSGVSTSLKTATLLPTPLRLNEGDLVRIVIANPFGSDANNDHCGAGTCYIGNDVANNIPTAKGLQIQLLDYNIQ